MLNFLLATLGLTIAGLINASHADKIAAIEKKINTLRKKNDNQSQKKLNEVAQLLQSNQQLASLFPRYTKILRKDRSRIKDQETREINRYHKTNEDLDSLSIENQNRHNIGIENKIFSNNKAYDAKINDINLNNFEREV